jgi:membrane-associated protease RseP (regulator of RpoE activity)
MGDEWTPQPRFDFPYRYATPSQTGQPSGIPSSSRQKLPWLNIILFVLTLFTTMLAGTYMAHYEEDLGMFLVKVFKYKPEWWLDGLPFAVTLMVILLSHEMAHYIFSRYHKVKATLPYFIPGPNLVGTFGAVIMMKSRITSRKALVDIGAAGPIAGFIVSLFALYIGLKEARLVPLEESSGIVLFNPNAIMFFAYKYLLPDTPEKNMVIESLILDAAWVGFFVTMLNLLPIGQLDGGHVTYAVFGKRAHWVSWVMVGILLVMSFFFWPGWGIFALFILILMGRRGIRHPPPEFVESKLPFSRKLVALAVLLIFLLTFLPVPFTIPEMIQTQGMLMLKLLA